MRKPLSAKETFSNQILHIDTLYEDYVIPVPQGRNPKLTQQQQRNGKSDKKYVNVQYAKVPEIIYMCAMFLVLKQ